MTSTGAPVPLPPDTSASLEETIARLSLLPAATLHLPDGVHAISRTLRLPPHVSLVLSNSARLRALPGFAGDALIIKPAPPTQQHRCDGVIRGGTLDCAAQPITAIRTECACRLHIADLEIVNATAKGIHVGTKGWYECNISNVRISLDPGVRSQAGSIGLQYERCTDSLINAVVIIGYETGVRSDSSSNDFHQVHVWNMPDNGPLKHCFYCNGWNDTYNQCYADSPFAGDETCYGFFVTRPFQRIIAGRIYCNDFVPDNRAVGIHLAPGATHGTYLANHFSARAGHRFAAAIDGDLDSACAVGNSFCPNVISGRVCQIPSGGGGDSAMPPLSLPGGATLRP